MKWKDGVDASADKSEWQQRSSEVNQVGNPERRINQGVLIKQSEHEPFIDEPFREQPYESQ